MRNESSYTVQTDARGRLLLPKELRQHLGIEPKGSVIVSACDDGSVVLRDPRAERHDALQRARGSFRDRGGSADELIAQRRAEAAREQGQA
ncbi:MAG: AbrB/MazE/SpoVT family DNA-binding domain-containing protein [Actinobacteria bacterium]|nr:AbrB/MazE/SpoVT family DNA-binding domain-containing protein [Actinomycetota bacterium]